MLNSQTQSDDNDSYDDIYLVGTVVANNDPWQCGRVKATVPKLFEGDVSVLPWILPNRGGLGFTNNRGVLMVPVVGTRIYIFLEKGDPHTPKYYGSPANKNTLPTELSTNYPSRYGVVDGAGNKIWVDMTPGGKIIHIEHASGTLIDIDNAGNVQQTVVGNLTASVTGNISATAGGTCSIYYTGNLTLSTSGNLSLSASGTLNLSCSSMSAAGCAGNADFSGIGGNLLLP